MMSNLEFYSAMASYTATHLTDSWQRWTAFLTTASRLYKYPFHEQLMIFAQRPDATACAEYDLWNDTMRRYVRRGSKGIALVDNSREKPRLRYVFDISDTGLRKNSRHPFLWELRPEHEAAVAQALAERFGAPPENNLENQEYQITELREDTVQLLPSGMAYPIFRAESRERFEQLLKNDLRNGPITEFLSADPEKADQDLREVLTSGLFTWQDKEYISRWLRDGEGNTKIAKAILLYADEKGRVKLDDIVSYFRSYYEGRRTAGLAVEKKNSIFAKGGYTAKEAERNILSNPFKRFEDMQMLRHTKTLGIVQVDESVWKKLSKEEKAEIEKICDEKLEQYYERITKERT